MVGLAALELDFMSPDKQRIAIAEAHGMVWCSIGTEERPYRMLCWWNPAYDPATMLEPICNPAYMWEHGRVSDYLNDLNAMREVALFKLNTATTQECQSYMRHLCRITRSGEHITLALIFANASQHAEAFVRTFCKWEE